MDAPLVRKGECYREHLVDSADKESISHHLETASKGVRHNESALPEEDRQLGSRKAMVGEPEIVLRVGSFAQWFKVIDEKLSEPSLSEDRDKAIKFLASELLDIEGNTSDKEKIKAMLNDLAVTKVGAKFFGKLLQRNAAIAIRFNRIGEFYAKHSPTFDDVNEKVLGKPTIEINDALDIVVNGITRGGEVIAYIVDPRVILFHELLHCFDFLKETQMPTRLSIESSNKDNLLHPDFHDLWEQHVITGIRVTEGTMTLRSENACGINLNAPTVCFDRDGARVILGSELVRSDHVGIYIHKGQQLESVHFAALRVGLFAIRKAVAVDPGVINEAVLFLLSPIDDPHLHMGKLFEIRVRPPTVALLHNQLQNFEWMLSLPEIDVNSADDAGTLLEIALQHRRYDIAKRITQHPRFDPLIYLANAQWEAYVNGVLRRYTAHSDNSEEDRNISHVFSPLASEFEELLVCSNGVMENLLKWIDGSNEMDLLKVSDWDNDFALTKMRAQSAMLHRFESLYEDEMTPYLAYLTEMDRDQCIARYVDHCLGEMDVAQQAEVIKKFGRFDFETMLEKPLSRLAERVIADKDDNLFFTKFCDSLSTEIEDPGRLLDSEIAKGPESLAGFLKDHWIGVSVLKQFYSEMANRG